MNPRRLAPQAEDCNTIFVICRSTHGAKPPVLLFQGCLPLHMSSIFVERSMHIRKGQELFFEDNDNGPHAEPLLVFLKANLFRSVEQSTVSQVKICMSMRASIYAQELWYS